jgi:hypothetical protein
MWPSEGLLLETGAVNPVNSVPRRSFDSFRQA